MPPKGRTIAPAESETSGETPTTSPKGLSKAGILFWRFMHDLEVAHGNEPREKIRSELIATFRENLRAVGSPIDECLMEDDHGYIQWLFPLETMGVNPQAPLVKKGDYKKLLKDENFKEKMLEHFLLFADFMGITYHPENGTFEKTKAIQWNNWIASGHNNLRITRILISLKNFGLIQLAREFLIFLKYESAFDRPDVIGDQTYNPFDRFTISSCDNFWSKALEENETSTKPTR